MFSLEQQKGLDPKSFRGNLKKFPWGYVQGPPSCCGIVVMFPLPQSQVSFSCLPLCVCVYNQLDLNMSWIFHMLFLFQHGVQFCCFELFIAVVWYHCCRPFLLLLFCSCVCACNVQCLFQQHVEQQLDQVSLFSLICTTQIDLRMSVSTGSTAQSSPSHIKWLSTSPSCAICLSWRLYQLLHHVYCATSRNLGLCVFAFPCLLGRLLDKLLSYVL